MLVVQVRDLDSYMHGSSYGVAKIGNKIIVCYAKKKDIVLIYINLSA